MEMTKGQNMKIWIATGGTGGHVFPALSVADELITRGHRVIISTDARAKKWYVMGRHVGQKLHPFGRRVLVLKVM